jgi:hypothetical protein
MFCLYQILKAGVFFSVSDTEDGGMFCLYQLARVGGGVGLPFSASWGGRWGGWGGEKAEKLTRYREHRSPCRAPLPPLQ